MNALRLLTGGCYDHRPPPPPPPTTTTMLSCKRRADGDCSRKSRSADDRAATLLDDDRTFQNLLENDDQHLVSPSYFRFQSDLRPYMRKMVVIWMLEVCEEQSGEEDVTFWLAVNYLDRILSVLNVKKNQLQLIASVCLFIASKFNASSNFITASHLAMYTDFSITVDELLEWELTVLQALKWSVSIATPFDFLHRFVSSLSLDSDQSHSVERHAATLITLSTTDVKFVVYPASMLASGCLCAAVKGLLGAQWIANTDLYRRIQQYTAVETDCLVECQEQIEDLLRRSLEEAAAAAATLQQQQREDSSSSMSLDASKSSASSSEDPSATTPTDVREISVNCGATFNSCK